MAASPVFTQGYNYGEALQKALYFYDAQRAGPLPADNAISPGGLAWLDQWGSLRYAANASLLAFIWAQTSLGDPKKKASYSSFAENQINNILGANPGTRSYEIGFGNNPPINPHHRTAHGAWYNDINNLPDNRHILFGALLGGPSSNDSYSDNRTDYQQNEVAFNYNSGFIDALARMYELYGGSVLPDFPENYFKTKNERYPEYFVRAKINSDFFHYIVYEAMFLYLSW